MLADLANDWQNVGAVELRPIAKNSQGWFRVCADMDVDGDGANGHNGGKPCYAPRNYGKPTLDDLAMAGHPGNWWGVVTDTGRGDGTPLIQGLDMPAPGAYISQTSYTLLGPDGAPLANGSPDKYLDSDRVPFIVLPLLAAQLAGAEIVLGCQSFVRYNGSWAPCVVGDKGPTRKIGEGSPALCRAIGVNPSARNGGVDELSVWYYWKPGQPAVVNDVIYSLQPWRLAA